MIISSEIENVEKVENLTKDPGKSGKSILRAFARTRAKNSINFYGLYTGIYNFHNYYSTTCLAKNYVSRCNISLESLLLSYITIHLHR